MNCESHLMLWGPPQPDDYCFRDGWKKFVVGKSVYMLCEPCWEEAAETHSIAMRIFEKFRDQIQEKVEELTEESDDE